MSCHDNGNGCGTDGVCIGGVCAAHDNCSVPCASSREVCRHGICVEDEDNGCNDDDGAGCDAGMTCDPGGCCRPGKCSFACDVAGAQACVDDQCVKRCNSDAECPACQV